MILAMRTDSMRAYLAACTAAGDVLIEDEWEAGRQLSVQLPARIDRLFDGAGATYDQLEGVVAYKGPGSFTGLRIGITIANTIAHTRRIPIVGTTGNDWLASGIAQLASAKVGTIVLPEYGGQANITKPKK